MKIDEALEYLNNLDSAGIKLGLENITALMEKLGNPEDKMKIIHIGGTNGKGSVSQMTGAMLQAAGYHVGSFTSPHLIKMNECIVIDGKNISDQALSQYVVRLKEVIEDLKTEEISPTYFEVLTAIALLYFYEKKVDFVILEVGLGGTLDATNVIKNPVLSVITKIAIDHKDFLGNTLEAIATSKAGIIKPYGAVVALRQQKEVMDVVRGTCQKQQAHLEEVDTTQIQLMCVGEEGTAFQLQGITYQLKMIGKHQACNGSIAIKVIECLRQRGIATLTQEQIKEGLYAAKWPGRFERISEVPKVFIDGAHNADGMSALSEVVSCLKSPYTIGIVGVLQDKEVDKMLELISPKMDVLIVTEPDSPRAMMAENLAEKVKNYHKEIYKADSITAATKKAIELAKLQHGACIIGFGSLYMIGEIRQMFI